MTDRNDDRDLIDRAKLVDFMTRVLAKMKTHPHIDESYLNGFQLALDEVQLAPRVRLPAPEAEDAE